ncbi:MAG: hypothetical protein HGB12_00645 [Bacteroidetes bacterium]|nr:hypothetical protein [Bacteroidota bacterium]
MNTFATIVEEIKKLSLDEWIELNFLTEKFIVEKHRNEFHKNHLESLSEHRKGKLKFFNNSSDLKFFL